MYIRKYCGDGSGKTVGIVKIWLELIQGVCMGYPAWTLFQNSVSETEELVQEVSLC